MNEHLADLGRARTIWAPHATQIASSGLAKFVAALGGAVADFATFSAWAKSDPEGFWGALWFFGRVIGDPGETVLQRRGPDRFVDTRFFPGARLNLAENLLRGDDEKTAVTLIDYRSGTHHVTFAVLRSQVARAARQLTDEGVGPGDLVLAKMPNGISRLVVYLSCLTIGATWTLAPNDEPVAGLAECLGPMRPRAIVVGGYRNDCPSKAQAKRDTEELAILLPSVHTVIDLDEAPPRARKSLDGPLETFERFPFHHPAVMLLSREDGRLCPITHGAGGLLLTHLKEHLLHNDLRHGDSMLWGPEPDPLHWLWQISTLACGCQPILTEIALHDSDEPADMWEVLDTMQVTHIGLEVDGVRAMIAGDYFPRDHHRLSTLRTLMIVGDTSQIDYSDWIYSYVKSDLMLAPLFGSNRICGHYFLGSPMHSVRSGELTTQSIALSLHALDDRGMPVISEVGKLVCTEPFPSMPIAGRQGTWDLGGNVEERNGVWQVGVLAEVTPYGTAILHSCSGTGDRTPRECEASEPDGASSTTDIHKRGVHEMSSQEKDGWVGVIKGRPKVGATASRSKKTSMQDIIAFTEMTGDRNPVHYDKALAEKTAFGKLVVQGGVTTGMLNACVAEDLPGPGTVFLSVEWKFVKAVGVDEEITGHVEVADVRQDKPICKLITTVTNADGDVCVSGTATTYTMPLMGL